MYWTTPWFSVKSGSGLGGDDCSAVGIGWLWIWYAAAVSGDVGSYDGRSLAAVGKVHIDNWLRIYWILHSIFHFQGEQLPEMLQMLDIELGAVGWLTVSWMEITSICISSRNSSCVVSVHCLCAGLHSTVFVHCVHTIMHIVVWINTTLHGVISVYVTFDVIVVYCVQ